MFTRGGKVTDLPSGFADRKSAVEFSSSKVDAIWTDLIHLLRTFSTHKLTFLWNPLWKEQGFEIRFFPLALRGKWKFANKSLCYGFWCWLPAGAENCWMFQSTDVAWLPWSSVQSRFTGPFRWCVVPTRPCCCLTIREASTWERQKVSILSRSAIGTHYGKSTIKFAPQSARSGVEFLATFPADSRLDLPQNHLQKIWPVWKYRTQCFST